MWSRVTKSMSITDNKKRVEWADNLKAFAIFLVVLGHTGLEDQSVFIYDIRAWIYEFHMPLFFLLSGLSFSIVFNRGGRSIAKQIINISLIYIIQCAVYILFNVAIHHFINIQTNVNSSLSNLYTFFINPVGHFWYLHALIIIYLVECILNLIIKDDRIKCIIAVILACIGLTTSFGAVSTALYNLLYFECGRRIINTKKIPMWLSAMGLVASFFIPFLTIDNKYISLVITVAVALSVSLFWVSMFSKIFDSNFGIVTSMGKNCLWIYIFHTYFTAFSRNICNRMIPNIPEISMVIVTIIGIAGPLFVMTIFKKIKIDKIVTKPITYFWK